MLRPARGGAAGVVLVFAILLSLAAKAGLAGIPLALLLISWLFKYAYVLLDHVVRGVDEPPALDITMVNPLDEQRPLAQIILIGAGVAVVKLTATAVSPGAAAALATLALLFLPASLAILGLKGNMLKAVHPAALVRMVAGLGVLYAWNSPSVCSPSSPSSSLARIARSRPRRLPLGAGQGDSMARRPLCRSPHPGVC
jgi:hypothetical protein